LAQAIFAQQVERWHLPRPPTRMSWDWNDRELTEWAKKTLPEFLLISTQDPDNKNRCISRTPWQRLEVCVAEVHVEGEANLIGKKDQSLFQFDLDIGMRIDVERKSSSGSKEKSGEKDSYWPGIAQVLQFDNSNTKPTFTLQLQEMPKEVAAEVGWFLREGMGRRYLWHGLARWHAYAVKKWMKIEPPALDDPYGMPEVPPAYPPFKEEQRARHEEAIKRELLGVKSQEAQLALPSGMKQVTLSVEEQQASEQPFIGKKQISVEDQEAYESPPDSDAEEEDPFAEYEYEYDEYTFEKRRKGAPVNMKKFTKYPFLPSMVYGVGGPSTDWLRRKEDAIAHPEWFDKVKGASQKEGVTKVDMLLDEAKKKAAAIADDGINKQIGVRAGELCDAIDKGDVMKVFSKLDEFTTNAAHPETGRYAAHCCVAKGSKELLQMVLEAKADLNQKDRYGQTPLMLAAKKGSTELGKMMLEAGADPTVEDPMGRSAADLVKVLPLEPDNPMKNWKEKLSGAPIPVDPAKATHELKDMIDQRERPKKYGISLIHAINQKDVRTAEASIEAGGYVDMVDDKGDTPLLLLAKGKWKDQEGVQVRLAQKTHKAGGNLDFQNAQGNTPLLFAAHRGNGRMVEALLAMKADATKTNAEGNTALMYAAHGGHEAICTALLEAFSPVKAKNKHGLTAEEMAQRRGFRSCAVLIQAYELAPKQEGTKAVEAPQKKEKKKAQLAFDYSKWDQLEKDMADDEQAELNVRIKERNEAEKRPTPKMEDLGPEAFGLPPGTPWPPPDMNQKKKGPFDYSRWDKIVDDVEKHDKVVEKYEELQRNPKYEWKDGQKMQVLL